MIKYIVENKIFNQVHWFKSLFSYRFEEIKKK
jgi:hypothetical protein